MGKKNKNSLNITKRLMIFFAILAGGALLACPQAIAAEASKPAEEAAPKVLVSKENVQEEKLKMVTKTLSGEISARGPNGIALEYARDEVEGSSKEMWFPYEAEVKLIGYKAKTDITAGDQVAVTYNEAEDGSKRVLTGIRLLKKKPPEEEEEAEENGDSQS